MAWSDAIAAVSELGKKILDRLWGNQTREEASLERRIEQAAAEEEAALDRGDVVAANAARRERLRLRAEAQARQP
jgi:hypothetical protein